MIKAALDLGVVKSLLAWGSVTNDAGAGMAQALGQNF
jgi:glycerate kinase